MGAVGILARRPARGEPFRIPRSPFRLLRGPSPLRLRRRARRRRGRRRVRAGAGPRPPRHRGASRRGGAGRRSGRRHAPARPVAARVELPAVDGDPLRRGRAVRRPRRRPHRRPVRGHAVRGRRARPGPPGARRRPVGVGPGRPHGRVLLPRQEPRAHVRHGRPVRDAGPPARRLDALRGWGGPHAPDARRLRRDQLPRRQHGHPDGRVVPAARPLARRAPGADHADPRAGRPGHGAARGRAPDDPRRRDLRGAGARGHRRDRVGRPARRRVDGAVPGRPDLPLPRVVGAGGVALVLRQPRGLRPAAGGVPRGRGDGGVGGQRAHAERVRRPQPGRARPAPGPRRPDGPVPRRRHARGGRG